MTTHNFNPKNDDNIITLELLQSAQTLARDGDRRQAAVVLMPIIADLSERAFQDLIIFLARLVQFHSGHWGTNPLNDVEDSHV